MQCPACGEISHDMARFCAGCGTRFVNPSTTAAPDERRQLTVLLCDLVDSTPLSGRLDPEELAEVIRAYQSRAAAAIIRFGGYIARYVGDGILSYFGWPENTEADPERAIRAALAIVAAVTETPIRGEALQVRVGVATGIVVVGDRIGFGEARQLTASGQTPNLAARLQSIAQPNTVIIDDVTRRQIGGLFTCADLGDRSLKGFQTPVRAWCVLEERAVGDRFAALHPAGLVPLIDRQAELELLLHRWQQATAGQGQIVLLEGEGGIGKSRLVAELRARLRGQLHANLRYFCSPYYQASPLHPVIARLEYEAGLNRRDGPTDKLRKLEAMLKRSDASAEEVALIADMLEIPSGEAYQKLELSPQARKSRTFEALVSRVVALARKRPVLLAVEDAHWADPSSLELLDRMVGLLAELPILLIVSSRGESTPPWIGQPNATVVTLSRLDQAAAMRLVDEVLSGRRLPQVLVERIVAQSEGVPLFVEELTKSVLENATSLGGSARLPAVPETLQALLTARLDRLSGGRRVAQIGAVIGRQFPQSLLASVAQLRGTQLIEGLDELVASGLAWRHSERTDVIYTFKHALLQEAIYDGLLRRRRSEIHARIVSAAERDASLGVTDPGLLGHHCAQAGLLAKAASYYRIAGGRSAERAAVVETRTYLERGLQFAGDLPEGADRHRLEAELHIALGRILMATKGPNDPEASLAFHHAVAVCRAVGEPKLLARALYSLGVIAETRAELGAGQAIGEELIALAESSGDAGIAIAANVRLGLVAYYRGNFVAAQDHLSEALALCSIGTHELHDTAIASDHVVAAAYLGVTLAHLGHIGRALFYANSAVESARNLGASSPAYALALSVWSRTLEVLRDEEQCNTCARMLVSVAEEKGFSFLLAIGQCQLGWVIARQGSIDAGLSLTAEGIACLKRLGARIRPEVGHYLMADILIISGRRAEAHAMLEGILAFSRSTGACWLDAELHRMQGELLLADTTDDVAEVERAFQQAITLARRQSARLFELRAATSLARLWAVRGRQSEARDLLRPIHAWFAEDADMPDLREAGALLAELEAVF